MATSSTKPSMTFTVVLFVAAAVIGIAVAYLGITGRIGGPIP
jgi:hypothetical protein